MRSVNKKDGIGQPDDSPEPEVEVTGSKNADEPWEVKHQDTTDKALRRRCDNAGSPLSTSQRLTSASDGAARPYFRRDNPKRRSVGEYPWPRDRF